MIKKLRYWLATANLTFLLTLNVFFTVGVCCLVNGGILWVGIRFGWLPSSFYLEPWVWLVGVYAICIVIGISTVATIYTFILKPIRQIIHATQRLATGDFSVRIPTGGFFQPSELRDFAEAFNTAAQELGSTELLRKDFVNNFSHEFKTPIASLSGFAGLLLEEDLSPEEQKSFLTIIRDEANRLAALSNSVLALSRIESQTILTDHAPFPLDEQLRQSALIAGQKWSKKSITFDVELPACTCDGNQSLLAEVWINLLDNAAKFSPEGSAVTVTLLPQGERVSVSVADQGCGMDAETQRHIFDQFYQGDTSHATEGNGLGLAMVKKVVSLHGGTIAVDSQPDHGSCFTVTLPLAPVAPHTGEHTKEKRAHWPASA